VRNVIYLAKNAQNNPPTHALSASKMQLSAAAKNASATTDITWIFPLKNANHAILIVRPAQTLQLNVLLVLRMPQLSTNNAPATRVSSLILKIPFSNARLAQITARNVKLPLQPARYARTMLHSLLLLTLASAIKDSSKTYPQGHANLVVVPAKNAIYLATVTNVQNAMRILN